VAFGNWWKRWTEPGGRTGQDQPSADPNGPHSTSADAADEAPARPDPDRASWEVRSRGEPAAAPVSIRATEEQLLHALEWRKRILVDGPTGSRRPGDGAALAKSLVGAGVGAVRQPPIAAQRALALTRDMNADLRELVRLFETDPALAPRLLKTANSAWYRRGGDPVNSISDAVRRVGMRGIESVVLGQMVSAVLCKPGGIYDGMVQKVWLHMQRTAPLARRLAPAFEVDAETAYALGLLHDVGKLVIFDHISQLRHALHREIQMPEPFLASLLAHLHEPLGGLAALRWGMDTEAAGVIAGHHRRTTPPIPSRLAELIYVAERVDLVLQRYQELDWEAIWKDGTVSADVAAVQDLMPVAEDEDDPTTDP